MVPYLEIVACRVSQAFWRYFHVVSLRSFRYRLRLIKTKKDIREKQPADENKMGDPQYEPPKERRLKKLNDEALIIITANNMPAPGVVCSYPDPLPFLYEVSRVMIFCL
jgi:hypothetical protein